MARNWSKEEELKWMEEEQREIEMIPIWKMLIEVHWKMILPMNGI